MRSRLAIAHRGNAARAPANTLEALQSALEIGVDLIEVDVRLSKDGVPVLFHDASVDGTTDGTGEVAELEFSDLRELDAGSWRGSEFAGARIPSLEEALACVRGRAGLALDIKDRGVIPTLVEVVRSEGMGDQVVLCGCLEPEAEAVWDLEPGLRVLLNTDAELEGLAGEDRDRFIDRFIARACGMRFAGLNVYYGLVSCELVYRAHLRALPVWTWTVDDRGDAEHLTALGVDAIYSNIPEILL